MDTNEQVGGRQEVSIELIPIAISRDRKRRLRPGVAVCVSTRDTTPLLVRFLQRSSSRQATCAGQNRDRRMCSAPAASPMGPAGRDTAGSSAGPDAGRESPPALPRDGSPGTALESPRCCGEPGVALHRTCGAGAFHCPAGDSRPPPQPGAGGQGPGVQAQECACHEKSNPPLSDSCSWLLAHGVPSRRVQEAPW